MHPKIIDQTWYSTTKGFLSLIAQLAAVILLTKAIFENEIYESLEDTTDPITMGTLILLVCAVITLAIILFITYRDYKSSQFKRRIEKKEILDLNRAVNKKEQHIKTIENQYNEYVQSVKITSLNCRKMSFDYYLARKSKQFDLEKELDEQYKTTLHSALNKLRDQLNNHLKEKTNVSAYGFFPKSPTRERMQLSDLSGDLSNIYFKVLGYDEKSFDSNNYEVLNGKKEYGLDLYPLFKELVIDNELTLCHNFHIDKNEVYKSKECSSQLETHKVVFKIHNYDSLNFSASDLPLGTLVIELEKGFIDEIGLNIIETFSNILVFFLSSRIDFRTSCKRAK